MTLSLAESLTFVERLDGKINMFAMVCAHTRVCVHACVYVCVRAKFETELTRPLNLKDQKLNNT